MKLSFPRRREPEVMDQPGLDERRHAQALRGLARINMVSASAGILWPTLARLARATAPNTLRVLDVATGGGDVPIRLARRARRAGLPMEIAGCDISATAIKFANDRARTAGVSVSFFELNALSEVLPGPYDAMTCSLFLHHLDDSDAVALLQKMAAAARCVLVNDLARSRRGLVLAHAATRLLSRSPVVHMDGPRSVEAAYTPAEALDLARRAGMSHAKVLRHWPCRFLLSWMRES